MPLHFIDIFEAISTCVLLGSVTVGCAAISLILLYNMALVLLKEAGQMPVLTATIVSMGCLLAAYLCYNASDSMKYVDSSNRAEDQDPIHFEEDPSPPSSHPLSVPSPLLTPLPIL
jgi:hypothetical protein